MKKNDYQRPTMKVVQLQHQCHILAGSAKDGQAGVQNYTWHDDIDEE